MEWLRKLLEGATIKDGKLDVSELMKSINTEFPKNAVPKDKYNEVSEAKKQLETDIKERDTQLETLKKSTGDNAELQKQIETLQAEIQKRDKTYALKENLKELGVTDVEYLIYKHGGIDNFNFDKEGKLIGLEDTINPYKESMPHIFKQEEKQTTQPGFKIGGDGTSQNPPSQQISMKDAITARIQAQMQK
ncbi:phage scaffolding protein [Hathewaya histolytica]|uniref:Minor structural GP20 protein n=1 Tax=Hathewaya histolytica TaxID=1498 RepID=A0A4U9RDB7_HATHI|nr:phage scaffolding protein [Hathewaya histolytica]VTQ89765.1 minor structural GP20 protein [Hathewaya histolytica]